MVTYLRGVYVSRPKIQAVCLMYSLHNNSAIKIK